MTKKKWITCGLVMWLALLFTCLSGITASASYATTNMKYYSDKKLYGTAFRPGKEEFVYSRIDIPVDGTLAISGIRTTDNGAKGNVDVILCNSRMNPIDVYGHAYVRYDKAKLVYQTYGVTKGTYYIRTSTAGCRGQKFQIFAWFKYRCNLFGGPTKAEAQTLEKDRALTGILGCTSFYQYKWFKFTVPERKDPVKLRILFNGGQGQSDIYLAGPAFDKTKKYQLKPLWRNPVSLTITLKTTVMDPKYPKDKKKAKETGPAKGTYYVLISKDARDPRFRFSSGGFAIKWW